MLTQYAGTSAHNHQTYNDIAGYGSAASQGRIDGMPLSLVSDLVLRLIRRHRKEIDLDRAVRRLAETSPHLLRDIGILGGVDIDDALPRGANARVEVVNPALQTPARKAAIRAIPFTMTTANTLPAGVRGAAYA